jgi:multimeric flavodoxin WrbA
MLIITASPRKKSNSSAAALYAAGFSGIKYETIDINRLKMRPCAACDKCPPDNGCIYDDDASSLIKKISGENIFIAASPVYFTGVPAPFKGFIDRNQSVWCSGRKQKKKKKGIIILTQGHIKLKYFRAAESEIRSFFAVNNIKTAAVIKLTSMDLAGAALKKASVLRRLEKAALLLRKK